MRVWTVLGILMAFCIGIAAPVLSDDWREQILNIGLFHEKKSLIVLLALFQPF
jgi:hypothetical protein